MNEITILSGKGGTGKTTITAALSSITENTIFCDSDVDAADLHLILQPEIRETHTFESGWIASVDQTICTQCGICMDYCRFEAIHTDSAGNYEINPFECEGCRLCERVCPEHAIKSKQNDNNNWFVSTTRFGPFVHAKMGPGEENSGKLVSQVRQKAKEIAKESGFMYILNDGPPGIGCPVIASLTGTHRVLIVIEPSQSSLHDAKRLIELVRSFEVKIFAIINKYDLHPGTSKLAEEYLRDEHIPLISKIPFDTDFVKAMINKKSIIEFKPDSTISKEIVKIWQKLTE